MNLIPVATRSTVVVVGLTASVAHAALVAQFHLDEGRTDPFATAVGSTVGGWTGFLTGDAPPAWVTNGLAVVPGGTLAAVSFDASGTATDGYVATSYAGVTNDQARTVAAWVQLPTNAQPNTATIVHYGVNATANRFTFRLNNTAGDGALGALRLEVSGGFQTGTQDLRDGRWHHVAVVHTGPGKGPHDVLLYVDGYLDPASGRSTANPAIVTLADPADGTTVLHIGNTGYSLAAGGLSGVVDEVRVYDEALSETQVRDLAVVPGTVPSVGRPPADRALILGGTNAPVQFSVGVKGSGPMTYQWKFNGLDLPGANGPTYTVDPPEPAKAGDYTVAVTNSAGGLTVTARLLLTTPPLDPPQQTRFVGDTASLSVAMPGAGPYVYLWQKEGIDLPLATNATLVLRDLKLTDAGNYTVKVTGGGYTATSPAARLNVDPTPSPDAALVAHFKLDEGTGAQVQSQVGGWSGTFSDTTVAVPAWVTTSLGPVPGGTAASVVFDSAASTAEDPFVVTTYPGVLGTNARTVAAWVKPLATQPNNAVIVSWGRNAAAGRYSFRLETAAGVNAGKLRLEVQGHSVIGTNTVVADGQWHHVAVVTPASSSAHASSLYVDGILQGKLLGGTAATLNTLVDTNTPVATEYVHLGNGGWSKAAYGFNGEIDEVRIYSAALTEAQIKELAFGTGTAPSLAQPLADQTIVLGDPLAKATFTVAANGSPPLFYSWKFNNTPLPAETTSSLLISPAGPAQAGDYAVTVTNGFGTVTASARLRVGTAPVEPSQQVNLVGGTVAFSVTMPGPSGYTYQWEKGGADVPGATGARLSLANLKDTDAGSYRVKVSLGGVTATSAPPATLKVLPVPSSAYAAAILRDGPEAYWRLGEANGAATAVDLTTFHNGSYSNYTGLELGQPGALLGDPNTSSQFSALTVNFMELPLPPELNDVRQFSLEAWVKPTLAGTYTLMNALYNLPSRGYSLFTTAGNQVTFRTAASLNTSATGFNDLTGGTLVDGEWSQVVATYDGAVKRLYVNGQAVGEQTFAVMPSLGLFFRLGAGNGAAAAPGNVLDGWLDEAAVYRKVLSPAQVSAHYAASGRVVEGVLTAVPAPGGVQLSWGGTGWVLQSTPDLGTNAVWGAVTGATSPHLALTSGTRQFFRLQR